MKKNPKNSGKWREKLDKRVENEKGKKMKVKRMGIGRKNGEKKGGASRRGWRRGSGKGENETLVAPFFLNYST